VRNLGEDLRRTFHDDRLVSISLDDVDRATTRLSIDLRYASVSRLKLVREIVDDVVAKHLMRQEAHIAIFDLEYDA